MLTLDHQKRLIMSTTRDLVVSSKKGEMTTSSHLYPSRERNFFLQLSLHIHLFVGPIVFIFIIKFYTNVGYIKKSRFGVFEIK